MLETKNIKIKESGGHSGAGKNMWHLFSSNDFLFAHTFNAVVFILGCVLELPELFQKILMPGCHSRYSN